jgi:hypothetical protein
MLDPRAQVVDLLLSRGLLDRHLVVDGKVVVYDVSSRHRNIVVLTQSAEGFFVKQPKLDEPGALDREATFYALASDEGSQLSNGLLALLPSFRFYDQKRKLLVLQAPREAEDLLSFHSRIDGFPLDVAACIGRMLGTVHSTPTKGTEPDGPLQNLPRTIPWILSLHTQRPLPSEVSNAADSPVLNIVHRYPQFASSLQALLDRWRIRSLIHGDIKFANIIRCSMEEQSDLKLVDWELVDLGDPLWDVGGVLQAYLHFCISAAWKARAPMKEFQSLLQGRIDQMRPAVNSFWKAYAGTMSSQPGQSEKELELSVAYAAARMIQSVFESSLRSTELNGHAVNVLQCSLNILRSPRQACVDLFGFYN